MVSNCAEEYIRAVNPRCRGQLPAEPAPCTPAVRAEFAGALVGERPPGRGDVTALLRAGRLQEAAEADRLGRLIWCRTHLGRDLCGYAFADLIIAGPGDAEHEYICPQCGCVSRFHG